MAPARLVVRHEHEAPTDMLRIDTKKLGRIVRPSPSHRVTGNRRDSVDGADGETLFSWPSTTTPVDHFHLLDRGRALPLASA